MNDQPLPEDAAIQAAHPVNTGRHDLYAEAMRMVGAKHSKAALVDLVNWLLSKCEVVKAHGILPVPQGAPPRFNCTPPLGPCACGAWHRLGDAL